MKFSPITEQASARILVVEDCSIVRSTFCALLENDGMARIMSSSNLFDGIELVENEGPFDLVMLDFNMPGMDGLSGLKKMIDANGGKPVGLISCGIPFDVVEEAIATGASGYIPKVLPPKMIVEGIRKMSEGQRFHANHFLALAEQAF